MHSSGTPIVSWVGCRVRSFHFGIDCPVCEDGGDLHVQAEGTNTGRTVPTMLKCHGCHRSYLMRIELAHTTAHTP